VPSVDLRAEIQRRRAVAAPSGPEPSARRLAESSETVGWRAAQWPMGGAVDLGPLAGLMDDPTVGDVLVVGADKVFAEVEGRLHRTAVRFASEADLVALAQRLAAESGRELTMASPVADSRLATPPCRVTCTLPPFSKLPTISLRKNRQVAVGRDDLLQRGAANEAMLDLLAAAVRGRANLLVTGATGAGKTTTLRHLALSIPSDERVVTVEETAELELGRFLPHVVEIETRAPVRNGTLGIDLDQALRHVLHMRPDRIVVGEVRHRETFQLLTAMGTGHRGAFATLHCDGASEVFERLVFAMLPAAQGLQPADLLRYVGQTLHLVIHARRDRDGDRRLVGIHEVVPGRSGRPPTLRELFRWTHDHGFEQCGEPSARARELWLP
jgi:pilus assembly protein CpaF